MDLKLKMVRMVSGNHGSIDTQKEQKSNQRQLVRTFNNLVLYTMTKKKKILSNKHDWVSQVRLWRWIWFGCITGLQQLNNYVKKHLMCQHTSSDLRLAASKALEQRTGLRCWNIQVRHCSGCWTSKFIIGTSIWRWNEFSHSVCMDKSLSGFWATGNVKPM